MAIRARAIPGHFSNPFTCYIAATLCRIEAERSGGKKKGENNFSISPVYMRLVYATGPEI